MRIKADFGIKNVFEGMRRQKVSIYKTSACPAFLLFGLPVMRQYSRYQESAVLINISRILMHN